ncbi:unnamed protein product [Dibothriocephalus latus]|uniref:Uncharacterized protein n=1 Tax=Dibothriocephalus latus TaxID=60516 RepID=A0A3P7LII6_DIBLA|nr:unnamed protein product [Dibothriocephalus latus]
MSSDDALYNLECDFDEQKRLVNFYTKQVNLLHPEDVDVAMRFACRLQALESEQRSNLQAYTNVAKQLSTILIGDSAQTSSAGQASEEIYKNLQSALICLAERTTSLKSRICWAGQNVNICHKLNTLSAQIAALHCALLVPTSERHLFRNHHDLEGLEMEVGQLHDHLEVCVRDDTFAATTDVRSFYSWTTDQVGQLSRRLLECRLQLQTCQLCLHAIQRLEELCDLCAALQLRLDHFGDDVLFRSTPISSKSFVQEFETVETEFIRILQVLQSLISTDRDAIKGRDAPNELVALYGGKLAELRQGLTCVLGSLTRIR